MFDFEYDKTKIKGILGPEVLDIQIDHLADLWEACPSEDSEVQAMIQHDRNETMVASGAGPKTEIAPGVVFECLVGKFNGAKNLTTGIVTLAPASHLDYHTHPDTEALTLLSGSMIIETEGRRYTLRPLDNIVIPPGVAHYAMNKSSTEKAVIHMATPTASPQRTSIDKFFSRRAMPDDSLGEAGPERVTRHDTAKRFEVGDGTSFIDFFNDELMLDIEMSGGYGQFTTGGRLPAHMHDFDESICIIEGQATCIVEGRQYALSDCATAMVPRGRVHYFINKTDRPMAMVWVYAGPKPQRLMVAEACATAEGNPWK